MLDRATLSSKSKNTPFDGQRMQGRVLMTLVGDLMYTIIDPRIDFEARGR